MNVCFKVRHLIRLDNHQGADHPVVGLPGVVAHGVDHPGDNPNEAKGGGHLGVEQPGGQQQRQEDGDALQGVLVNPLRIEMIYYLGTFTAFSAGCSGEMVKMVYYLNTFNAIIEGCSGEPANNAMEMVKRLRWFIIQIHLLQLQLGPFCVQGQGMLAIC